MRHLHWVACGALAIVIAGAGCAPTPMEIRGAYRYNPNNVLLSTPLRSEPVRAAARTAPIGPEVAGPAIWIHPTRLNESLVVGIDRRPGGDVYTFGLDGTLRQRLRQPRFPRAVAIINGFQFGSRRTDLCVVLDRSARKLVVYGINPNKGMLWEITGKTNVFEGQSGAAGFPMGLALFRSGSGRVYAFVSRKVDDGGGAIYQYELVFNEGRVDLKFMRDLMPFSNYGIVEAMTVDSLLGTLYVKDPTSGILKFQAEHAAAKADLEIARFANEGWLSDAQALTILPSKEPGKGFLLGLDANSGRSRVRRFLREGQPGNPNDHLVERVPFTFDTKIPRGMDAVIQPLDDRFPEGVIAIADAADGRIKLYSWRRVRVQNEVDERRMRREKLKDVNESM